MAETAADRVKVVAARIRSREKDHIKLLFAVLSADEGAIFGNDLIGAAAIQRSLMLTKGFLAMLRSRNYLCAGALLRMQVDTLLRLQAAALFPSGNTPLTWFLQGKPLSKLKAPDGKPLTDKELCSRVAKRYEWVPRVYERTSGFIHFSSPAMFSIFAGRPKGRTLAIAVGRTPGRRWRGEERLEAAEAFEAATHAVLDMVYSWGHTKALVASQRRAKTSSGKR